MGRAIENWLAALRHKKKASGTSRRPKNQVRKEPAGRWPALPYTLNELPQPQVLLTLGLLNLKPEPSIVSM
jgi:hypothetical protein